MFSTSPSGFRLEWPAGNGIRTLRELTSSSFALASNGFVRGGPTYALEEFLLEHRCGRLVGIYHPLLDDEPGVHHYRLWERGEPVEDRRLRRPSKPPLTYPLDLLTPAWPPAVDCWVGFNALAAWRGLLARRLGRAGRVVYWCVDFTPDRFGAGSAVTAAFDRIDRACCEHADLRVELSREALEARNARHRHSRLAPAVVVPMGAWLSRTPSTPPDGSEARTVVYLGHQIASQGGTILIEALGCLARRRVQFRADIIGRGPLGEEMRRLSEQLGLSERIRFHGYIDDHREIERILAEASVGVAPYDPRFATFSRYADVGKLKSYLAAGLPIVVTDVPPNARQLEADGVAEVVECTQEALADGLEKVLTSPDVWRRRRVAALRLRENFDWEVLLSGVLRQLGFTATD